MNKITVISDPMMARQLAIASAKTLVGLWAGAGVRGIDHAQDIPQVQMINLKALHDITGGVKLHMERAERYTRYSVTLGGVEFYFLSPKAQVEHIQ